MPLIQKIIQVGDSRMVTIPASWLRYYEKQTNQIIKEVTVEVNGKLTIHPIFLEAQRNNDNEQKKQYFPTTNLKELITHWENSIGENVFFELNDVELKEEVMYITQRFSDWVELLNKIIYRKKTSNKEIIHIIDFENLAKKVPKFIHDLTKSPGSFIGLCTAKEIINDTSKIMGINNEKILLLPLEDKLFGVNIPIFTASQLAQNKDTDNLSNPLEKIVYSMGISQYFEEIKNKKFLEKVFEKEIN